MMYKFTEQYNKGQFFTPANLAAKMIDAVPNDLWGKPGVISEYLDMLLMKG